MRLRKELTNLPATPAGEDDGAGMGNIQEPLADDTLSSQGVEALQEQKMNERSGNVTENKGSRLDNQESGANAGLNQGSQKAEIRN